MNDPTAQSPQATLSQTPFKITVRQDLKWDFSQVPVAFDANGLIVSYMWAGFVVGGPPIERFFVKALKPTVDTIEGDAKLKQDVEDMIAQEVQHAAAHMVAVRHLESIGYDIKGAAAYIDRILQDLTHGLSPIDMLGVVAAGEHTLYSIAKAYVSTSALRQGLHPQIERLFSYHLLEEAEHGAVSHDQYRYFVGDNYWHRLRMAWRARHVFRMLSGVVDIFARGFGHRFTLKDRLKLQAYLWVYPGLFRRMLARILHYVSPTYRLGFQHEDLNLLERWNRELYAGQQKQA
jgi:predicted metal-dependent hydrolase